MNQVISLITIGVAVLMAGASIPLIFRLVPMNDLYGARFRASYRSEKAWYEINAHSGKGLFLASLAIAASAVPGFFVTEAAGWYVWFVLAVLIGAVGVASCSTFLKARRVDEEWKSCCK